MDYKEVIKQFKNAENHYYLSDDYLKSAKQLTRKDHAIAGEYAYGIVYLQDTAVETLINKIEELEEKLKEQTA